MYNVYTGMYYSLYRVNWVKHIPERCCCCLKLDPERDIGRFAQILNIFKILEFNSYFHSFMVQNEQSSHVLAVTQDLYDHLYSLYL